MSELKKAAAELDLVKLTDRGHRIQFEVSESVAKALVEQGSKLGLKTASAYCRAVTLQAARGRLELSLVPQQSEERHG